MQTCHWIYSQPGAFPVHKCGAKVPYVIVRDDDGHPVRKYAAFCPEHQAAADKLDADEEASQR